MSDDMPGHEMPGDSPDMMGMAMSFHFSVSATILFDFWKTTDVASLLGSVVLIFFLGVAYEGLKYFREYLNFQHNQRRQGYEPFPNSSPLSAGAAGPREPTQPPPTPTKYRILEPMHFAQTALHFIQFVLSYCLMLIFMTYNVWLCLGVAVGATVGYFFFGWQRQAVHDASEHCH